MAVQTLRLFPIFGSLVCVVVAGAQEPLAPTVDESAPLPENERQQITLSLLDRYPLLSASPGVKDAWSSPARPGVTDGTVVIYYPHSEHHGIKEAFEAHCRRTYPEPTWTCDHVEIRRYLQLASQDWEVRVKGEISSEAAFALIEGSRRQLQASLTDVSRSSTAVMITALLDGQYFITWGTPDGRWNVKLLAQVTDGGDPTNPSDWRTNIFNPPEPQDSTVRL